MVIECQSIENFNQDFELLQEKVFKWKKENKKIIFCLSNKNQVSKIKEMFPDVNVVIQKVNRGFIIGDLVVISEYDIENVSHNYKYQNNFFGGKKITSYNELKKGDYVVHISKLRIGGSQHCDYEGIFCGGKGVNVSTVLNRLDYKSVSLGFIAGFTGDELNRKLIEEGIHTDFIKLKKGFSRLNVKIKAEEETDIDNFGPEITPSDLEKLFDKLHTIKNGDTLVLAGSIPKTLKSDIYEKILEKLQDRDIKIVVDATGELLLNALKFKPFLIKPNNFELSEVIGKDLTTIEEYVEGARKLKELGAKNVIVSMADKGALLIDEFNKEHYIKAPKGTLINSVGAGDSLVAGFIVGYNQKKDYDYALKLGVACGSASAFSMGLADKETIEKVFNNIV